MEASTFLSMLKKIDDAPTRVITVTVGQDDKIEVFCVLASVLCHHSAFFRGALNGDFLEAKTNSISLPEDDPTLFGHILLWMHGHRDQMHGGNSLNNLLQFLLLADKLLLDPSPVRYIVDNHLEDYMKRNEALTAENIKLAYAIPSAKPIATRLAVYSVESYITAIWSSPPFRFSEELRSVKGYAQELLRLVTLAFCKAHYRSDPSHMIVFVCPITNELLDI